MLVCYNNKKYGFDSRNRPAQKEALIWPLATIDYGSS